MYATTNRRTIRRRIRHRIRKKLSGTASRPRIAVFRSQRHVYVQAIDDEKGVTLAQASSQGTKGSRGSDIDAAKTVGSTLGQKLKEAGVQAAIFDRGGFLYHGRVRAVAEAVREAGVKL